MQPFCIATVGAILGIVTGLYFKSIAFFVCVILGVLLFVFNTKYKKYIIVIFLCFVFFCIYVVILESKYEKIYDEYNDKQISLQGIVVSNGSERKYRTQYEILVKKVYNYNTNKINNENFKVICSIKGNLKEINLKYGDEITFETSFEAPEISRNKGGFNYRQYLKTQQIAGKVTTQKENIKVLNRNKINIFASAINNLKIILLDKIYKILPKDEAGLCAALLLGDKSGISSEIEDDFRQASLSHMLAISGAHISYIWLGIANAFDFLKIHKRWSKIFICMFLIFFMFLAGGSPSVVRACIMVVFKLIAKILFLKSNTYNNLGISAFIIFIFNPYAILDLGLQLSFMGTIGIVTFVDILYDIRLKRKGIIKKEDRKENEPIIQGKKYSKLVYKTLIYIEQTIIMALAANMIIIPIMLYDFSTLYLTFIISNLLATPIMGACLILGMIFLFSLLIPPLAHVISFILEPLLKIFILVANFSSNIPFSKILLPKPKIWQVLIYYLIIVIYFFKDKINIFYPNIFKNYKKIIVILTIIMILPYILLLVPQNKLEINFIDVGQGDSMLITTPSNKKILIDGGGSEFGSFDVGEQTLLPYLLNKSILTLDYVLFTHFDTDHCQGLLTVLENIKVKNVIIGEQGKNSENFNIFLKLILEKNINIIKVKKGDVIVIDKNCKLDILFPDNNLIKQNILNNNSIVAKFIYGRYSILLTGDIEKIAEEKLIQEYKNTNELNSTILKVAHHGSKSSSIQQFLNMVEPKIALIGVGEKNTFGHPNSGVIERLEMLRLQGV